VSPNTKMGAGIRESGAAISLEDCRRLVDQISVAQNAGFDCGYKTACDAFAAKASLMCSTSRSSMRNTDCICDIVARTVDAVRAARPTQQSTGEAAAHA